MQFFFSPVLGSLSDRFGRRPVVLLSNFGLGLDYLLMAWAPALGWLFLGRVISGLTASSVPTGMAYMTDVTPPEKRAGAFGLLGAAFGVGFILGPALGGILGSVNPRLPFWVAGGLSLLNGMYGLFVLPESLPSQHRSPFSWKRANPHRLADACCATIPSCLASPPCLILGYLAQQSLMNVYVLLRGLPLSAGPTAPSALACAGRRILRHLWRGPGQSPSSNASANAARSPSDFSAEPPATSCSATRRPALLMLCGIPVLNLMSVAWPSAQSIMSREVKANQQGQMQGAIQGLRGLAGVFGPVMFTWVFSKTFGPSASLHLPGAAFYLASALVLLSFLVAQWVRPREAPPAITV